MITPVTALLGNRKSGAYKTVHVKNLRYARINDGWDLNDCNDDEIQEEFPELNTRPWILHRRKHPDRKVKISRTQSEWNTCGMMKIHKTIQLMKKSLRGKKTSYIHAL